MRIAALLLLLLAGRAAAFECPKGMYPFWGFNQYQDLRYSNRGRVYMTREAHARCPSYPVFMHDMLSIGARE